MNMTVTDGSLLSVYHMLEHGHDVHFTSDECHMRTRSGERRSRTARLVEISLESARHVDG